MVTVTDKTARELILDAVGQGNHTAREIADYSGINLDAAIFEIEILEDLELFRLDPPDAPATSWWTRRPKGRIIRGKHGKLVELPPEPKPVIPIEIVEKPPLQIEKPDAPTADYFEEILIGRLRKNPRNPRGAVNTQEQAFENLVNSIKSSGIHEPLIVTPDGANFRIVAGHRRYEAAVRAGLRFVPCLVRRYASTGDEENAMLIENIQRKDLTPMQEGRAFKRRYVALAKDIHAVARETGLTQSYIAQRLRLLKLDLRIQEMVDERKISFTNALLLTALEPAKQIEILNRAVKMKAADLKSLVENLKNGLVPPPKWKKKSSKRVTADDENFTRSWAIAELTKAGETYFTAKYFRDAFDDVCQDSCVEMQDESLCISCPVPRLIAAMLRHKQRSETKNAE